MQIAMWILAIAFGLAGVMGVLAFAPWRWPWESK